MSRGRAGAPGAGPGALLRAWREAALLTQEELAERAGVNVRTVRRLEADHAAQPQSSTLRGLAAALRLTPQQQAALVATVRRPAGPPGPDPVPRQLPAAPAGFTGRTAELADLDHAVGAGAVVITAIDGMAGVGKSALALHAAHRLAARYPDGQLFLDLHGHTDGAAPVAPGTALERMLRALGVPDAEVPAHVDDRAALYRSRLAGRRMLVLLDDAASEAQVAPLLPGAPGCLVLVTSRRRLAGLDRTCSVTLDVLAPSDAVALFVHVAGEQRLAAEPPEALAEVVERCGRLPLAIRIAAARLRSRPSWAVARLIDLLADEQAVLAAGDRSVTAALDVSYRQLSPDLRHAYRSLSLHPGPDLDRYAAAALIGAAPAAAGRLIDELVDVNLVQEPVPGRYRFHDLVRAHASATAGRDEPPPRRRAALGRLLDHYRCAVTAAVDVASPSTRERRPHDPGGRTTLPAPADYAAAAAWLDAEMPNLVAAASHAAAHGRPGDAVHLSVTLHHHARVRGRGTGEALHEIALSAARSCDDRAAEAEVLVCLAWARRWRAENDEAVAHLERALTAARALGLPAVEVDALVGLGGAAFSEARFAEAERCLTEACATARRGGDRDGEMQALLGLGWVDLALGRPATEHFEGALHLARTCGDGATELHALFALGRHSAAARAAGRAAGRDLEVATLLGLGWVHGLHGRDEQAAEAYRQALAIAREMGDPGWQFEAAHGLGRLQLGTGHPDRAFAAHRAALAVATARSEPVDEARAHDGLAQAHLALGERERAREHWLQALSALAGTGSGPAEGGVTAAAIRARLAELGGQAAVSAATRSSVRPSSADRAIGSM